METYFKNLTEATPEKLLQDLDVLEHDTDELFRVSEGRLAAQSRDKFVTGLERVKATCRRLQEQNEHDEFFGAPSGSIQRFPYGTMGIVFGLGMLAGLLIQREGR